MQTYRTSAQWQQLFQLRSHFSGTNVEFCQHHHVSIATYYKQRTLLTEGLPKTPLPTQTPRPTASRFVQVKQTTEISAQTHQNNIQFDMRTGQLTLPVDLATTDIVAIVKGLAV
ncbi:hypothetical protein [Psychromonas sp. SP041]|uniref:hypothetical protein n=1 Tax=Psychromonas sp. SP041 TaxID=1365007 RepID=UPI0003F5674D|nr:hypothetical protein [Psychromonas sp. SP041]